MVEFGMLFLKIYVVVVSGLFSIALFLVLLDYARAAYSRIETLSWIAGALAAPSAYVAAVAAFW